MCTNTSSRKIIDEVTSDISSNHSREQQSHNIVENLRSAQTFRRTGWQSQNFDPLRGLGKQGSIFFRLTLATLPSDAALGESIRIMAAHKKYRKAGWDLRNRWAVWNTLKMLELLAIGVLPRSCAHDLETWKLEFQDCQVR